MESPVNLMKIKRKAHGLSRHDSSGSSYYNPFRHVSWKTPKRANTYDDAERGEVEKHDALQRSSTAPASADADRASAHERSKFETSAMQAHGLSGEEREVNGASNSLNDHGMRHRGGRDSQSKEVEAEGEDEKPKKRGPGFLKHIEPKEPFTLRNQLQRTFLSSWINILILAAPAGIAINYLHIDGRIVFGINFIAIIPLAAMLSFATEEIALRTGEVVGGLINATFGNAVELIVAIIALTQNKTIIVQTSLVGSILSNLLLVLGLCFFCGGINRREQYFNTTVAQTAASLLALAVGSLIVPTVFAHNTEIDPDSVPRLSHGVSVILLIVYLSYLLFQLKTHSSVFNEESQKVPGKKLFKRGSLPQDAIASGIARAGAANAGVRNKEGDLGAMMMGPNTHGDDDEDGEEEPQLSLTVAFVTLTAATVLIAFCAEAMVSGIEAITAEGVSEEFVGLILLPIVGNACEHATAVTVAIKDKMDLAIGVAIGSSMQVALFLIPLLVIIGWGMGNPYMTLAFDDFQIVVLFVSVLLVNYLIGDGKSHWLEGALLVCLYFIIAVCSWWYPADTDPSIPGTQVA